MIDQVVQGVFNGAGHKPSLRLDGNELWVGIDGLVAKCRHETIRSTAPLGGVLGSWCCAQIHGNTGGNK